MSLSARIAANQQFIVYCLIGISGVTLDFVVFALLVRTTDIHVQWANAIGYASGTMLSFILNSRYNFKTRDRLPLRFVAFCGVAAFGWAVSASLLYMLIEKLSWDKYAAKVLTIVFVVLVQYNLNRMISFRKSNPKNV